MKISYLILLLSFVLLISFSIADPKFESLVESPVQYETIILKLSTDGEFVSEINKDVIHINNGIKEVYLDKLIYYHNNDYYISFSFNIPGTYNVYTDNLQYRYGGEYYSGRANITIIMSGITDKSLQISPGIVYSKKPELKLTNKGKTTLEIEYEKEEFEILSGETKILDLSNLTQNFSIIEIESYKDFKIPVFYIKTFKENLTSNSSPEIPVGIQTSLSVRPETSELNLSATQNKQMYEKLLFKNFNNKTNITNFTINSSIDFMNFNYVSEIMAGESINVDINYKESIPGKYSGNALVSYIENKTKYNFIIPLNVIILSEEPIKNSTTSNIVTTKTCDEMTGKLCNGMCIGGGEGRMATDGFCCVNGECYIEDKESDNSKEKSKGSKGLIVGIIIFVVIGLVGYLIFQKYKKVGKKGPKNISDVEPIQNMNKPKIK